MSESKGRVVDVPIFMMAFSVILAILLSMLANATAPILFPIILDWVVEIIGFFAPEMLAPIVPAPGAPEPPLATI